MRKYHNQIWTKVEVELLKEQWKNHNQRELKEKFFPEKTVTQVKQKKMQMGLKKGPKWSEEETELLFKYGPHYTSQEMCNLYLPNKTKTQVHDRRSSYNIKRVYS